MRDELLHVSNGFGAAQVQDFAQHPMANYVRDALRASIVDALGIAAGAYRVRGGAGAGRWAAVPWVAVFDPLITTSATRGYYVVYLFAYELGLIHLSLNQGTTAVQAEFGAGYLDVLRDRAALIRARVPDAAAEFPVHVIEFGDVVDGDLPNGYAAGHAFGKTYHINELPTEEDLRADLSELMTAYLTLTFRGGLNPPEEVVVGGEYDVPIAGMNVVEIRRYKYHLRIDRNPSASHRARLHHGTTCQVCNLNFEERYGELGAGYIEAHHLRPLAELEEGVPVELNIERDFAVLCANCHRMAHRLENPADLDALRGIVRDR
jgi:5-methylcytosine-specific restriction protein A